MSGTLSIRYNCQTGCLPARRSGTAANTEALKIRGEEKPDKYSYNGAAMLAKIQPSGLLRQADGFHSLKHTHTYTHTVYGGMLLQDPPRSLPQWSCVCVCVSLMVCNRNSWPCLTKRDNIAPKWGKKHASHLEPINNSPPSHSPSPAFQVFRTKGCPLFLPKCTECQ